MSPVNRKLKLPYSSIITREESFELVAPVPLYRTVSVSSSYEYTASTIVFDGTDFVIKYFKTPTATSYTKITIKYT
jgi:hypothetical protein